MANVRLPEANNNSVRSKHPHQLFQTKVRLVVSVCFPVNCLAASPILGRLRWWHFVLILFFQIIRRKNKYTDTLEPKSERPSSKVRSWSIKLTHLLVNPKKEQSSCVNALPFRVDALPIWDWPFSARGQSVCVCVCVKVKPTGARHGRTTERAGGSA